MSVPKPLTPTAEPFVPAAVRSTEGLLVSSPESTGFKFRWTGNYYDEESELTYIHTNWDALRMEVETLAGGRECEYEGRYHEGGRHIVRRIVFTNEGDQWLARVPIMQALPTPEEEDEEKEEKEGVMEWSWGEKEKYEMESEIATMAYVREHTQIPIPKVFGYNSRLAGNPVNIPYILMECMKGNAYHELMSVEPTEEIWSKVRSILAWVQCQLAAIPQPFLGSLMLKDDGTAYFGPLPSIFGHEGPYTSTSEYLLSWTAHAEFALGYTSDVEYIESTTDKTLEFLLRLEASIIKNKLAIDSSPHEGCYYIVHPDLTPSNVLFDDQWNLVAVIDWELAFTAPLEIFAAKMARHYFGDTREDMGRLYLNDVQHHEKELKLNSKLSASFGSTLGNLAKAMNEYEAGTPLYLLDAVEEFERSYE